jgi:hypothetical protein
MSLFYFLVAIAFFFFLMGLAIVFNDQYCDFIISERNENE